MSARHPFAARYAAELRSGALSRREFLTRVTALGLTPAAAYALGGFAPAAAQEPIPADAAPGDRILRIQQEVRPLVDPRTADWSEIANVYRGWLEYLVENQADGTLRGMLLEGWEVNADATGYVLRIRPGVTWTTGQPFNAEDVLRLFDYWCDSSVAGNVMSASLASLVDSDSGKLIEGAVRARDELTVEIALPHPDATLIVALSDYPAACVPPRFDPATMLSAPVGTGPFLPVEVTPGSRAILVRDTQHVWWGNTAPDFGPVGLDRIDFVDLGTDPASWIAAAKAGAIDMLYENVGPFIEAADGIGWQRSEVTTGATLVLRGNQTAEISGRKPYAEPKVRRALQRAISNEICLELGYDNRGEVAADHHVSPIQPDYADIGPAPFAPETAPVLIAEAGFEDLEHEVVTLDDGIARATGEAIVALLVDAGIRAKQVVLPGSRFWAGWKSFPLSVTEWNHRPLGIQTLNLAYRSGAVWNESGYANPAFDAALDRALSLADAAERSAVMAELERMLRLDAVIVQPFWRKLFRHYRPGVTGAEMHPSFELHLYKLGLAD
ncbi:ABC transporter substrate-binding protein [Litorisediminicola beolgyonensis]|uniref:ABC transporter substrate-binding protein n=1 Tax=Litorisediminicola beolgyonensis TaxID=1173614 RepID=A0ABW3ZFX3_9RHOB